MKEDEFERSVNAALFNVAQQLFEMNNTPPPAPNPVKQVTTNYFIVLVHGDVDASLLEFLLRSEFEKRNIQVDFEYGIYDCSHEKMKYGNYIPLQTAKEKNTNKKFPAWNHYAYYFGVQFPNRESHLLNQMGIWSFSTFVMMIVIVFFGFSLFVILKQKRLSEIQKDFINNMTHEFKTPLATIAVSAEVLKNPEIVHHPDRLINYAAIIEKENNRLKNHVERVLQIAKLDKNDLGLKKEQVDVHELLAESIRYFQEAVAARGGVMQTELMAAEHIVKADRLHLINVFNNLIDNAIKYCTQQPTIIIRSRNEGSKLVLEFSDNGIGISRENQRRVFQKFYRVPTGNVHDVKGFGLGLSYVRTIVEAHGGQAKVSSEPEKGSTFSIILPL